MNKLYISYCTEYEAGWGQRPDGLMLSLDLNIIEKKILEQHDECSYELFWRYSQPEEIYCDDETFNGIKDKMSEGILFQDKLEKDKFLKTI